jgi:hypothetical protein
MQNQAVTVAYAAFGVDGTFVLLHELQSVAAGEHAVKPSSGAS